MNKLLSSKTGRLSWLVGSLCLCSTVYAASTPDAGQLLRDLQLEPTVPATVPDQESTLPPPMADTGRTVEIKAIRFVGHQDLVTDKALQKITEYAIGRALGFNGLQHLADRVTEYLKRQGYFIAFAYLPQQDITDGELTIMIQPGRLEMPDGKPIAYVGDGRIAMTDERINQTVFYSLQPDKAGVLHAKQFERGLLNLNDLAGVEAKSNISAGKQPGTTRVELDVRETSRYGANVWLDNYGNRYTGTFRSNVLGHINNFSGMGDQLGIMASVSEGVMFSRVSYLAPLGYSGLSMNAALGYMTYRLGEEYADKDIHGSALSGQLGLRYPLIRSRINNLYVTGHYEFKSLSDEMLSNPAKSRLFNQMAFGLNGDWIDQIRGGALNNYSVNTVLGQLDLDDPAQAIERQQGFAKLNVHFARLQKLSQRSSLWLSLSAQPYASAELDPSEKFSIGGPSSVRAYPSGETAGDLGWQTTAEWRYDWPNLMVMKGKLQLQGFFDMASVTVDIDSTATNNGLANQQTLMGAGFGFNITQAQKFVIKGFYAVKVADQVSDRTTTGLDSEGQNNSGRIGLQAMVWF